MHELLLFGQVPRSRHKQVLSILAGIAAMQPQPFVEKHLVFKPARLPGGSRPAHVGAVQGVANPQIQAIQAQTQGDIFYLQLVADVEAPNKDQDQSQGEGNRADGDGNAPIPHPRSIAGADEKTKEQENGSEKWTLQFRDLPEVARRPVTSRLIYDIDLQSGDSLAFMSAIDYKLSYVSIALILFRPHVPLPPASSSSSSSSSSAYPALPPHQATLAHSRLLDPSGTYILQAALRVSDGTKPELMTRGITELLALKEMLKGVVELTVGERLTYPALAPHQTTLVHPRLLDPSSTFVLQAALRVSDGTKPEPTTRGITELLALKEMLKGVVELTVGERHISTYLIILILLLLFRPHVPLPPPPPPSSLSSSAYPALPPHQATLAHPRLLDPSGTYILQAALRVSDGTNPEPTTLGITELLALNEMLKGVVELTVGERLSLDTNGPLSCPVVLKIRTPPPIKPGGVGRNSPA
ncbi:Mediator of RNA polymerase II transcription subunit 18 [Pseudocyphellaria aurata]|nr:Mediator of RNA polymerase II transcription subunit 18 [Pseudocyphellaria aurata]